MSESRQPLQSGTACAAAGLAHSTTNKTKAMHCNVVLYLYTHCTVGSVHLTRTETIHSN